MIVQLSVFIENRPGQMMGVLKTLADVAIDINGLSVTDTAEFGILRMIVSDPERGAVLLREAGYVVKQSEVLAIQVTDHPGALCEALGCLEDQHLNVEYMYAFGTKLGGAAMIILKTDDARKAVQALQAGGVEILTEQELLSQLTVPLHG